MWVLTSKLLSDIIPTSTCEFLGSSPEFLPKRWVALRSRMIQLEHEDNEGKNQSKRDPEYDVGCNRVNGEELVKQSHDEANETINVSSKPKMYHE